MSDRISGIKAVDGIAGFHADGARYILRALISPEEGVYIPVMATYRASDSTFVFDEPLFVGDLDEVEFQFMSCEQTGPEAWWGLPKADEQ